MPLVTPGSDPPVCQIASKLLQLRLFAIVTNHSRPASEGFSCTHAEVIVYELPPSPLPDHDDQQAVFRGTAHAGAYCYQLLTWSPQDIRRMIIGAVLATDISQHFTLTSQFCLHGASWIACRDSSPEGLLLLCKAIVHAADLSNPARPFPIYAAMAQGLHQEFQ